ncbi:replication factor A2 [Tothia fuscella]|uniref:Replication factor A2 n=1 Tax=Tothia fuscella TaxID=1048955 RepID=A0A9P4NI74_9PEZI|nr:replication factor A2 [Tothia fuscella]
MTSYGGYTNDYSNTSYGAQGGAGGGGFMTGGSQNSPSGGDSQERNDTLRPVTIKQVNESQESGQFFNIDNSHVSQVTFVGQVRSTSIQTTNITYKLDDGTGTVEVKQWIDPDQDESSRPRIDDNAYVRVWGKIKQFNNKKHVGAHFVRPITDFNEISYHLLEATAVHLYFTKGPLTSKDGANGAGGGAYSNGNMGGATGGLGADGLPPGLSANARKIYHCLRTTQQSNEGLHTADIAHRLQMESADLAKGGDELLETGVIYTTVDDQTWAILNTSS